MRTDGAGCSKAFLAHIPGLRGQAVVTEFTVGWAVTDREREAIGTLPDTAWTDAIDADGQPRDGAAVASFARPLSICAMPEWVSGPFFPIQNWSRYLAAIGCRARASMYRRSASPVLLPNGRALGRRPLPITMATS